MIKILKTDSIHKDFVQLVQLLDQDLAKRNGDSNEFFATFNKIQFIQNVVIASLNGKAVACGTFKQYNENSLELKRMYCLEDHRGNGFASMVLKELESWAKELGYQRLILETGNKMPEAIGLYKKSGYHIIPNFGPYEHIGSSICFEKELK